MKLSRRQFLHLASSVAVLPAFSSAARGQAYPSRPVRIIVGFPPGGGADIVARLIAQQLSERLGQPFIVENRPGAGSNIGTEAVVRAPADGYTLLLVTSPNAINATLYDNLNFNFIRDIAPVAGLTRDPNVLEVNVSMPAKTVPELIAYAKAHPGRINYASTGIGTPQHVAGELFKAMAGVDLVHVPYRGAAPALTDLIAGQVQVMFDVATSSIGQINAGKVRALAVTGAVRSEALPDLPTLSDYLPGYEASNFRGIGAPRKTPPEIVDKLYKEITIALADPNVRARIGDLAAVPLPLTPDEFGKLVAEETDKWGKIIRAANMKAD
jgi:tripartite-type tricarboxylate transporter receptor subunit TctC